jgi:hypothetical protein
MRRFLAGFAIDYNRRHGRQGHLFQSRATTEVAAKPVPTLLTTRPRPIESVASGEGQTVLGLHSNGPFARVAALRFAPLTRTLISSQMT